jgi:[NiFe] hydrogenase diaphorase moiety large subunit
MIGKDEFSRTICYDDLATGGSVMIFGPDRDILSIVHYFMDFFVEESCGYCTPCRVGNVLLKQYLEKVMAGNGDESDLDVMEEIGETVRIASRCGFGQTSPNPILTSLKNFRSVYEALIKKDTGGMQAGFDIKKVLADSEAIAGRKSVHFE